MKWIGRYELVRTLGAGGMGTVHEAVLHGPAGFTKRVALKVLHRAGAGLVREARLGGLLQHPNLVEVYELGQVDGTWFCAMELVEGGSLAAKRLPPRAVVDVGLQVCAGLQHAHEKIGLVHMDLKPANLLLEGALVKVADLGIARARGFEGGRGGTPGYMAPEQARGEPVDVRADLYALGVTLHELATGQRPEGAMDLTFDFDSPEAAADPFADVPWLAPVLGRCMAPHAAARFASMAELAEALAGLEVDGEGLAELVGLPSGRGGASSRSRSRSSRAPAAARSRARTNIGAEPDALVGREAALAGLDAELERPGLVTLKGPAGVGKTRLARAAARAYGERTGEQAWFCDLAGARSEQDVWIAVARALDIPLGREPAAQVGHGIAGRGAPVLVLDNFEQVAAEAGLVEGWLGRATEARFLVTSRVPLRRAGERVVEVAPLGEAAARDLLVERARERGRDIAGDPALVALARELDGLPLALELAAGRLGLMDPSAVLERLGDRLRLLRGGGRGATDRQATLRGALDWGWELLADEERAALAQLSVFVGGFSVEAAEAVLALDHTWALDAVDALVERSWVVVRDGRLGLLESVRVYAAEKLGDAVAAEARHGAWFAGLTERLEPKGSAARLGAIAREIDNAVMACRRAVARGDGKVAVGTLVLACEVLDMTGPVALALKLQDAVLGVVHAPLDRARALQTRGITRWFAGRAEEARVDLEAALEIYQTRGERGLEGQVRGNLGLVEHDLRNAEAARAHYEAALAIARELGDRRVEGIALATLGTLEVDLGRLDEAEARLTEALAAHRASGARRQEATAHGNLGTLAFRRGDLEKTREHLERAHRISREVGDRRSEGITLGNLGVLLARLGRTEEALATYARALVVDREVGHRQDEAVVLGNLAGLHRDAGRIDEARAHYQAALAVAGEVRELRFEGWARGQLARLELADGREEVFGHLDRAEALMRQVGDPALLGEILAIRAEALVRAGDVEGARSTLVEAEATAPADYVEGLEAIARARTALGDRAGRTE